MSSRPLPQNGVSGYGAIAVTCASGHLGSVLARKLLDAGYPVRAIVRSRARLAEAPWVRGDRLEVVEADATDAAAMRAGLEGVIGVFHVAALFDVTAPARTLIDNNVRGVEAVMEAAAAQGVGRIVLTSSSAAVGTSATVDQPRSEADWNEHSKEPYALSKLLAEQLAWDLAKQLGLDMISVLPGALLGPGFNRPTPTFNLVGTGFAGGFPMAPPIDFAFTDVRDVADVHVKLYQSSASQGRYLASGPVLSIAQLLAAIARQRPAVTIPKTMPVWFARLFPLIDALQHTVTGKPRQMRRGFVAEYVGRHHALSTEKLQREIGWSPRPFEQTLRDHRLV